MGKRFNIKKKLKEFVQYSCRNYELHFETWVCSEGRNVNPLRLFVTLLRGETNICYGLGEKLGGWKPVGRHLLVK